MGILLVVGTIALFVAIYIKFGNKSAEPERYVAKISKPIPREIVQAAAPVVTKTQTCDFESNPEIELSGKIMNSIRNGNTLTIITEKTLKPAIVNKVHEGNSLTLTAEAAVESPQQIVIFDLCEGEIISRIDVVEG